MRHRNNAGVSQTERTDDADETRLADIALEALHAVRPHDEPYFERAEPPSKAQVPIAVVDHGT